jgi:uncharacterized membrane protein
MKSFFVKSMILGIVAASCCFSQSATAQDEYSEAQPFASPQLSYRYVVNEVFRPRCYRCHSDTGGNKGDLNLETYAEVYANRAKIREMAIVKKAMPPRRAGGPLNARQLRILDNWLMAGAPLSALVEPFEFDGY